MQLPGKAGPTGFLPRLGPEAYRGRAVVFWTHTVARRATGWLRADFHAAFRESVLHAAVRENLLCPIYTLMPDHLHLIWMGVSDASDQRVATRFLRGSLTPNLRPFAWQHQPHDRVLRDDERMQKAFEKTVSYIAENPLRAGLTEDVRSWPYTGCVVPGYPELYPLNADYWAKYWRIYAAVTKRGLIGKMPPVIADPAI